MGLFDPNMYAPPGISNPGMPGQNYQLQQPTPMTPPIAGNFQPPPTTPATSVQSNLPSPGGLTSSPSQTTGANIQNLEQQQQLAGNQGDVQSAGYSAAAQVQAEAAAEKQQQAADFNNLLQQHGQAAKEDHDRVVSSWKQHAEAAAASGKDPTNEFWNDHGGFAGRLLGSLGAFASGLGSGLLGKGGNPFLDHINDEINKNYDAHRKHIDDLYNSAVEAGRIEKDSQSKRDFDLKAKLQYYDLASQSIQHQLDAVANTTQSGAVKLLAQKTALDLDNQITGARSNLYQQQAAQGAAALAQQRAWDKEVRAAYQDALTKHGATMSEADARVEAAKDVEAAFGSTPTYHQSLAKVVKNTSIGYDTKTGKYIFPETLQQGAVTPEGIPTTDIYGHRRKPEEIEKDKQLVTRLPDGTSGIANNADDKKVVENVANGAQRVDDLMKLVNGTGDPNKPGLLWKYQHNQLTPEDWNEWKSAAGALTSMLTVAETGGSRAASLGALKLIGPEMVPQPPPLSNSGIAGQVGNVGADILHFQSNTAGKLVGLQKFKDDINNEIKSRLRPETLKTTPQTQQTLPNQQPKTVPLGTKPQ